MECNGGRSCGLSLFTVLRHFVISHLPKLCFLDDSAVSPEEREAAERVYGRRRVLQGKKENPPQVRMFQGFDVWWYSRDSIYIYVQSANFAA